MPDLDTTIVRICSSNDNWEIEVKGSGGKTYRVRYDKYSHKFDKGEPEWSCSCPAYKFKKGHCKHIVQAQKEWCGWGAPWDEGGFDPVTDDEKKCPKCGEDVEFVRWAV
jgi:hypothetical protein